MKITRVIFYNEGCNRGRLLATCSVVLDECLKLNNIKMYKNAKTNEEYLILPSKQDIYNRLKKLNPNINIDFGENTSDLENCKYEEYFHPVECYMYRELLDIIRKGYEVYMKTGKNSYRPKVE